MGKIELVLETEKVKIYSPRHDGESLNEFKRFMQENKEQKELQLQISFDAIIAAIHKITECGARENLFRPEGGKVKAIPLVISFPFRVNRKIGKMRLYCLRISDEILIIGNGGVTTASKWENDIIHAGYVKELRKIDALIRKSQKQIQSSSNEKTIINIIESLTI